VKSIIQICGDSTIRPFASKDAKYYYEN
jgi:hypothetical protein